MNTCHCHPLNGGKCKYSIFRKYHNRIIYDGVGMEGIYRKISYNIGVIIFFWQVHVYMLPNTRKPFSGFFINNHDVIIKIVFYKRFQVSAPKYRTVKTVIFFIKFIFFFEILFHNFHPLKHIIFLK